MKDTVMTIQVETNMDEVEEQAERLVGKLNCIHMLIERLHECDLDMIECQVDRIICKLEKINVLVNDVQSVFVSNEEPPMVQLRHWKK